MASKRSKDTVKKVAETKPETKPKFRTEPRSPKTNLIWSLVIIVGLFAFSGNAPYAISAGIFAFLVFNTIDYMIFYNRFKKDKENK